MLISLQTPVPEIWDENEMGHKTRRKSNHLFRLSLSLSYLDSSTINVFDQSIMRQLAYNTFLFSCSVLFLQVVLTLVSRFNL